MYFGPFPALIRIVPNVLLPRLYGQWSRVSCLLAALGALGAFARIISRSLAGNASVTADDRRFYSAVSVLAFGLGTPLLYLISCGHIYHEAMLWGLCWSLWTLWCVLTLANQLAQQTAVRLALLSGASGAALLSRVTFGVPLYLMIGILLVKTWFRSTARLRHTIALGLPATLAGCFQLWYDFSRYQAGRGIAYNTYVDLGRLGGLFNISRVASALYNYFGFRAGYIFRTPPFVRTLIAYYFDESVFFTWKESVISLSLASMWLVIGASIGSYWLLTRRGHFTQKLLMAVLSTQCFLISTFYFVTQRYAAEYLPFLTVGYAMWLSRVDEDERRRAWLKWCVCCLVVVSVWATVGSTLDWNVDYNADAPIEYREWLRRFFRGDG